MDETMKQFQQSLIELETEAEHLLLARHQVISNPKTFCFQHIFLNSHTLFGC